MNLFLNFLMLPIFKKAKYWTNPQFMITLRDVDVNDDENMATVIISLMQKDTRLKRITSREESNEEFIQFRFYKVKVLRHKKNMS